MPVRSSSHSLHPAVLDMVSDRASVGAQIQALALQRQMLAGASVQPVHPPASVTIPLTSVSCLGSFDAVISIEFPGDTSGAITTLLVDSGNSMLIVPSWEQIQNLPVYQLLGSATEPWGAPANVVQGPINIQTANGGVYTLPDCIFYACTGTSPILGKRTANFGAGCLVPWSTSGNNVPPGLGVTMQAPLSYNTSYPFAVFRYAAAANILAAGSTPTVTGGSSLVLYGSQPAGFTFLNTTRDLPWMSLIPTNLQIGATVSGWPGNLQSPIAMIDTGGGPVNLSDPFGFIYNSQWPQSVPCPSWTNGSQPCQCVSDDLVLALTDGVTSYSYAIAASTLPQSAQGLTLVMCQTDEYMFGKNGMNIGGISALFRNLCVDYANGRVGFM